MRQRLYVLLAGISGLTGVGSAHAQVTVYGSNGTVSATAPGLITYLGDGRDREGPAVSQETDRWSGQWMARVERPGVHVAAVEEAYGFGPALRPGVVIGEDRFNRVEVILPFQYDLLDRGEPSGEAHEEFGQSFVAAGTAITAIAFKDYQGVLISLHEGDADGAKRGPTVRASNYYPHGTMPTVPGQRYYLRFVREDGSPFRMHVADGNRYRDGLAFIGGRSQSSFDLALRIQYQPAGQILRHRPGTTELYKAGQRTYGQTFTATGTSLAMLSVYPAWGDQPPFKPTIRVLESGPGGKPIASPVTSRILVFNPDQVTVVPGNRYYIEVSAQTPGSDLRMWTSLKDDFEGGHLFLDGTAVPDRDLAMTLVEYEPHTFAPPSAAHPSSRTDMHPYAARFAADDSVRLVWDIPSGSETAVMIVRRLKVEPGESDRQEQTVAEIPVSAQGRYEFTDHGLSRGSAYRYTVRTADAWGNESSPLNAPVMTRPRIPVAARLLNGDFSGPADTGHLPYGWMARTLSGAVPAFRLERPDDAGKPVAAAGWEVPEGAGHTDTVLYQHVPCEKGRRYQVMAEARLWNPWDNQQMVICALLGIDPAGGGNPLASSVVWSSPVYDRQAWVGLTTAAVAESDHLTVYLRGFSNHSRLMNTRFRGVRLTDVTHGERP